MTKHFNVSTKHFFSVHVFHLKYRSFCNECIFLLKCAFLGNMNLRSRWIKPSIIRDLVRTIGSVYISSNEDNRQFRSYPSTFFFSLAHIVASGYVRDDAR